MLMSPRSASSIDMPMVIFDVLPMLYCRLQDGPTAPWVTVPLPCESPDGAAIAGSGACTLAAFKCGATYDTFLISFGFVDVLLQIDNGSCRALVVLHDERLIAVI